MLFFFLFCCLTYSFCFSCFFSTGFSTFPQFCISLTYRPAFATFVSFFFTTFFSEAVLLFLTTSAFTAFSCLYLIYFSSLLYLLLPHLVVSPAPLQRFRLHNCSSFLQLSRSKKSKNTLAEIIPPPVRPFTILQLWLILLHIRGWINKIPVYLCRKLYILTKFNLMNLYFLLCFNVFSTVFSISGIWLWITLRCRLQMKVNRLPHPSICALLHHALTFNACVFIWITIC